MPENQRLIIGLGAIINPFNIYLKQFQIDKNPSKDKKPIKIIDFYPWYDYSLITSRGPAMEFYRRNNDWTKRALI